jgi:Mini-chromosome maintenance replisome factor
VLQPGPPAHPPPEQSPADPFADEAAARNPAGIPRVHVVALRLLDGGAPLNPLLNPQTLEADRSALIANALLPASTASAGQGVRAALLTYLASALHGDALAAEYVLMNVLGRPAVRSEVGGVMGNLTVNIVLPAPSHAAADADALVKALEHLLPAVVRIHVTVPALNLTDLYPRKDYAANRLRAAPLQLPAGCMLVADETGLDDGQLLERGVRNVRALTSVATRSLVPVDFQYYESELLFDANALFVSKGCKSIVPCDAIIRVVPAAAESNTSLKPWSTYSDDEMQTLRLAVSLLIEHGDFSIPDASARVVEDTFVAARKDGRIAASGDGQETLARWLGVARTSARTFGEKALSAERWAYAVGLDSQRESRNRTALVAVSGAGAPIPPRAPIAAAAHQ